MNSDETEQMPCSVQATKIRKDINDSVVRFLARREHSRYELKVKLIKKDFDIEVIDDVLDELEKQGLVSNERFAEAYSYHRKSRGFGPARIISELKERQVPEVLISGYVNSSENDWFELAVKQREKKFGLERVSDFGQKAKQMRFLQQKGFTHDQISYAMDKVG